MSDTDTGLFFAEFLDGFLGERQRQSLETDKRKMRKLQSQLFELQLAELDRKSGEEKEKTSALDRFDRLTTPLGFDISPTEGTEGRRGVPEITPNRSRLIDMLVGENADPDVAQTALRAGVVDAGDLIKAETDIRGVEANEQLLESLGDQGSLIPTGATLTPGGPQLSLGPNPNFRTPVDMSQIRLSIRNDFKSAREAISLQNDLENTALATGTPFGEFMRQLNAGGVALLGRLGFDVSKQREIIAKRDRLNKIYASGVLDSINRLAGTGSITNDKFAALQAATPTLQNSASANQLLLADQLQAALDAAEIDGIDVPERAQIEQFIKDARQSPRNPNADAQTPGEAVKSAAVKVSDVVEMSLDQLRQIDPRALSNEAREAARRRWNELSNAE